MKGISKQDFLKVLVDVIDNIEYLLKTKNGAEMIGYYIQRDHLNDVLDDYFSQFMKDIEE